MSMIGQGCIGEVHRDEDTTLKRQVAQKILPEVFARDTEWLGRISAYGN